MTSMTIALQDSCAGNGHHHFAISGDKSAAVTLTTEEILAPITEEEVVAACKIVARMAKLGRTFAQAKSLLQGGVTITV